MTEKPPRKRRVPAPNRQPGGKDYRPAGGKPASGTPAGGEGIGGPARGAGRAPGIGPTSAEILSGRARNALIADLALERVGAALARIDRVMGDDAHPQAFAAAKYVIDRVAGTPAASVTVTEEAPSVVTYRWLPEIEAPGDG